MQKEANVQIRRLLGAKCAREGVPLSGTFELTPRCNLTCKMCYVRMTPQQMKCIGRERTTEEWLALAQEAKDAGMVFLLLTGGEPTLRYDFTEIYESLAKMGFSISINSNGTLFNKEIKELFHIYPPALVNITLYGLSRKDYAEACGDPNAYDKVINTIEWLKQERITVHLNTTMTPVNVNRWEEFEEYAKKRELDLRMTTYCFPPVRRKGVEEFQRLTPEEAGELTVKDMLYRNGVEMVRKKANRLGKTIDICKLDEGESMQCLAAKSQFWINWDGTMVPCGMLEFPKTYPFKAGFSEAWNLLKKETSRIYLCPECTSCEGKSTCMNCAAVVYTETGRFDGKPEYMCRLNQAYRKALETYSE